MKKIFILTGEPSGDKLASSVISKLNENNQSIQYLSVGGMHLNALGIKSIFELKEITYIGFTDILLTVSLIFFFILNIFNKTSVKAIYVISLSSNIDFIPNAFKCIPPTLKY